MQQIESTAANSRTLPCWKVERVGLSSSSGVQASFTPQSIVLANQGKSVHLSTLVHTLSMVYLRYSLILKRISTQKQTWNELKQSHKEIHQNQDHIRLRCWGDYKNGHYSTESSFLRVYTCQSKHINPSCPHSISFTFENVFSKSNSSPQLVQFTHWWQLRFLAQGLTFIPHK